MKHVQSHQSVHGHLQQRFTVLSTMAMAFAILKCVTSCPTRQGAGTTC